MVLFSLLTIIIAIGLFSSLFSFKQLNRVAIIVLLLSGVLAFHAMWVGQLDSGVGIFNGIFQASNSLGIDLFIYIAASLILLTSEILNVNKAGPRIARRASGSLNTSSEVHSDSPLRGWKIIHLRTCRESLRVPLKLFKNIQLLSYSAC
jgi:hypothetical protein